MSSAKDRLNRRLQYQGGDAEHRLINDKLLSLKGALTGQAYQSETIVLEDGREFRGLINPNKETGDYDNKILSIPYENVRAGESKFAEKEKIGIKCGDVFTWKETDTHWLVYLQYLEENANAYFRAQIRLCEKQITVGDKDYWIYLRGPVETSIPWNQKGGVEWNDINYSKVMFITLDENTVNNLRRFDKVVIKEPLTDREETWQVVDANSYYGDGIIQVYLDEYYNNTIQSMVDKDKKEEEESKPLPELPYISGPSEVAAFGRATFAIEGIDGGHWFVNVKDELIDHGVDKDGTLTLDVNMKKGSFEVIYKTDDNEIKSIITVVPF